MRALSELDLKSFQGRLLRLQAAKQKPAAPEAPEKPQGTSSYKRKLQERKKKVDAHLEHTWNLLYVSANSAADAAAAQLGVQKSELFGKDAEGVAVTQALTETSIIQQTWLGLRSCPWESQEGLAATRGHSGGRLRAEGHRVDEQQGAGVRGRQATRGYAHSAWLKLLSFTMDPGETPTRLCHGC